MEATQAISDSILESEEEENEEENQNERQKPLAKLCILSNPHIPEKELPLFLGDNVLGRDPNICTLQLLAPSVSKQHATISISVYQRRGRNSDVNMEALVWDAGSMNGTRKGRLKLTPNVRYALSEGDTLVLGNIPCRYVSSRVDSASALGDMGTTPCRHSEASARLSDFSDRKWDDVDAGSKKCVNIGAKAERIPVTGGCLSFEQTPIQPKGTLVPESDSDSEGEGGRRGDRRQKTIVSDSDSHKSSPSSSAFLSPKNLTIPESEDESPNTPSSSSRNGSNRRVSFSLEKTDVDLAGRRQQTTESPVFVENGEQEAEEGAVKGGTHSGESGTNVKLEINESLTGDGGSTSVSRDDIAEFHLDSDTDVEEGEEEATPAGQRDQPPNIALSHRDGDTDVSEEVSDEAPKALPSTVGRTEPSQVAGFQLEGITIDSDTDADDDDDVCLLSKAMSCQPVHSAEPAPSARSQDFHLDSDTDVDEEEERGSPGTFGNKSDKPPTRSAAQNLHPGNTCDEAEDDPSAPGAPADLDVLSDSDTDVDEELPVPSAAAPAARQPDRAADADVYEPLVPQAGDEGGPADLGMESDTDVEDEEANLVKAGSLVPLLQNCSTPVQLSEGEVAQMETQAFTSPTSDAVTTSLRAAVMSSCSDSQEDEDFAVAETQSFILQTRSCPDGFRANLASVLDSSAAKPEDRSPRGDSFQLGLSDSSHLQGEVRALAMENTQAYVSAEDEVNLEETQAYEAGTAAENDPSLEATQPYGEDEEPARCSETAKKEGCADLAFEATQAYSSEAYDDGSDDDKRPAGTESVSPARSSTLAVAETQPALSPVEVNDPVCSVGLVKTGARNETAEHQGRHVAGAPSVAETQPMCASDGEDGDAEGLPAEFLKPAGEQNPQRTPSASFLAQTQPMSDSDDDGRPAQSLQPDASSASSLAETQPLHVSADETQPAELCDDDEGNEDDETLRPRKRKAKQLYVGDKESQQHTDSVSQTAETQPVDPSEEDDDDDDEDSMPRLRKRKAKPLQLEDETQTLVGSQVPAAASQPSAALEEEQSSEDFMATRRRKAKPLLIEDEQTQPLVSSEAAAVVTSEDEETQPAAACDDGEGRPEREAKASPSAAAAVEAQTEARDGKSDGDKSVTRPRKSKAKQLHLQEEEETQPIAASEASSAESRCKTDQEEVKAVHRRTRGRGNARKQEDGDEEDENTSAKKERPTEERGGGKVGGEHGAKEDVESEKRTEREELINATPAKRQQRKKNKSGSEKEDQKEKSLGTTKIDPDEKPERTEEEQERRAGLEEASESKENQLRGSQENGEKAENPKGSVRARRAARRTAAAPREAGPQQNPASAASEDFPARRTRSRSSSSNSVSSERSASAANAQESKGRGRGARRRSSDAPQTAAGRSSRRRTTAAAAQLDREAQVLSASTSSQNRGRGGGGRGRKTFSHPVVVRECEQNPTVRSRKPARSSTEVLQHGNKRKADSQLTSTSRGQQRASAHASEALVLNNEGLESNQEKISADLKSPVTTRTVRGRGSKAIKTEPPEEAEAPTGGEARNRRTTRTSQAQTEVDRGQKPTEAGRTEEQKEEIPAGLQRRRTSRASSTQVKDEESLPEMEEGDGKTVVVAVGAAEKRARGRTAVVQKNKNQGLQETQTSGSSLDQDGNEETSQIPAMTPSRKRRVSSNSSPVAKTPRSSSASPATISRLRAGSQAYKVLFTGVVDESGERVLARLGGAMAKGVSDMNCLVTDKVRRTVKFLCAVAKGVPVVTTQWLEKSGKAGSFLSPCGFVVKDPEQEKKFGFSLQESLRTASSQPLLQGYEIHVTKSVKPEPVHMKDIITCSGATFLPKMPTVHKPRTVVISCEEDLRLCGPATSASLPVVTAEFILTGILQQKVDFQAHALSAPAADPPPAEGRGRGRKKP